MALKLVWASGNKSAISPVLPATPIYGHWVLLKDEPENCPLRVSPHSVQRKMLMRMCRLDFPSDFPNFNNREVRHFLEEELTEDVDVLDRS